LLESLGAGAVPYRCQVLRLLTGQPQPPSDGLGAALPCADPDDLNEFGFITGTRV